MYVMNIALLGYGKMGREIERIADEAGVHTISIALENPSKPIDMAVLKSADVAIDFTSPEIVLSNFDTVSRSGTPLVIGTTGWYDNLSHIEAGVKKSGIGLVYGANFSVGAHIFFRLLAHATQMTSAAGTYDVYGLEVHHAAKKDSPSGTGLKAAQVILENSTQKMELQSGRLDRAIRPEELHFASVRGGRNPGHHQVTFDSHVDSITISHSAHNRQGFAEGAILAAEFVHGKKGLYTFDDVMSNRNIV